MVRAVILSPSSELGGAERSLLTFLQAAPASDLAATVLLPRAGPLAQLLSRLGIPWQVLPMPPALLRQSRQRQSHNLHLMSRLVAQMPGYLCRLRAAICRLNPDVLYTNGIKANILGALLRPGLRAKVVWHLRDMWGGSLIGRLADFGPHVIIANSRFTAGHLQRDMKRPGKVRVVHNAVDLEEFSPAGGMALPPTAPPDGLRIGLPGALVKLKGHRLLLEAAAPILAEFPRTAFYFIGGSIYDTLGDRGYEMELRRLVAAKGLEKSVAFTGFQERMAPWYRAMDLVVNCSLTPESFGRTLLEAMACGTPVVGPEAGGIPEFVSTGVNGLLYEPGNAPALAAAVLTLLRDESLRECLGAAGRRTAEQNFSPGPRAAGILRILTEATNNPERPNK